MAEFHGLFFGQKSCDSRRNLRFFWVTYAPGFREPNWYYTIVINSSSFKNFRQKYFSKRKTKFYRILERTDSMRNPLATSFSGSHRIYLTRF